MNVVTIVHKTMVGEAYKQEIHEVLMSPLLDTHVTPIGTPSSSSTLDNTYAWNHTSTYLWVYQESPLGHMKPSLEKFFYRLVVTIH